jgi:hypothetical protein
MASSRSVTHWIGQLLRTHITTLPLAVAERLGAVCDRFEAACGGGLRPRIDDYLEGVEETARAVLARELIVLDLHYRHCRAEVPQVTDYDSVNPDRDSNWLACAVAALTGGSARPKLPGNEILGDLDGVRSVDGVRFVKRFADSPGGQTPTN